MSSPLPKNLAALLELMDEMLDRSPPEREAWLESLGSEHRDLVPELRRLLVQSERTDFLNSLRPMMRLGFGSSVEAGQSVGPYRLERFVGRGGMAEVWLAKRTDGIFDRREFAVKLPNTFSPGMQRRLEREREILAGLSHPGIARLYDAGMDASGRAFLAMEYIDGVTLPEFCSTQSYSIAQRLDLFLQVLEAVQYAHSRLVIHRDIKPSNILITARGRVTLLDFGIAKLIVDGEGRETELTQAGGHALTLGYASPEQILGLPLSTATDVYSLGVVLFELLTGQRPYEMTGQSRRALEDAITAADVPRASVMVTDAHADASGSTRQRLAGQLAGDLDAILARALRKNSAQRFSSVQAMQDDLQRFLSHEPVHARQGARWYVLRLYARRHWRLIAAASMIIAVLLAGVIATTRQARLARVEAGRAQAVKNFVLDIFHANSAEHPDGEKARHATAEELLDISRRRIFTQLRDQPEVRREMVDTLIELYQDMQSDDKLEELSRAALRGMQQTGQGSVQDVAHLQATLGLALAEQSKFDEAIHVLTQALAALDRNADRNSEARADVLLALGQAEYGSDLSHEPQTRAHIVESLGILEACCALDRRRLRGVQMLGRIAEALDEFPAAEVQYRRYVELAGVPKMASTAPLELADALLDLGSFLYVCKRYDEAAASLRESLAMYVRIVGETVRSTAFAKQYLGQTLTMLGKPDEGVALLNDAVRIAETNGGDDNVVNTISIRTRAARVHFLRGDLAVATDMLERNMRFFDRVPETADSRCLSHCASTLDVLAEIAIARGDLKRAEAHLRRATVAWKAVSDVPQGSHDVLLSRMKILRGDGKVALRELEAIIAAVTGGGDVLPAPYALAKIAVGEAQLSIHDDESAAASLGAFVDSIRRMPHPDYFSDFEARALQFQGVALFHLNRLEDAESCLRRAVELRTRLDVPFSPWLALARIDLGHVLAQGPGRAEAKALMEEAREALHQVPVFDRHALL